jgi:cobalt/nickel transport system permease protein
MTLAFDTQQAADSPLTRFDPRWKLAAIVVAMTAAGALQSSGMLALGVMLVAALLLWSRLPAWMLWSRFSAFGLFLLPFLVYLPIVQGWDGLAAAGRVAARALMIFGLALVLVGTAPFHRTIQAAQALGVPRVFTQIILMSYRYLFVLRDEFLRIRTAMRVRAFKAGTNRHTYQTFGYVAGSLLIRGDERAQRVAQAMRCRGFDGRFRSLHPFRTRAMDVALFGVFLAISAAVFAGDWFLRS